MNRFEQAQDSERPPIPSLPKSIARGNSPSIPDHQIVRLISSGAYGEVWLGSNAVGTPRAVKVVRRDQHASSESFEREFKGLQKFEPISRSHEGIVDILTLGILPDSAGFYYVMELADHTATPAGPVVSAPLAPVDSFSGVYRPRTLSADFKSRGAFPAHETIALGLKVARALAHLHGQGLVHRDVKPSNILYIGGEPKLADPGLVAQVDEARSLVGTAGYIAPEGPGTPQADLYALGKVLYEAAFGKDRQDFPALPAGVAARSDHASLLELNAVLLKACATNPRERYPSADRMLASLELLQAGGSVKKREISRRIQGVVWRVALTGAALAGIWAAARSLIPEPSRPAAFHPSLKAGANREYREGLIALHANDDSWQAIRHFEAAVKIDPQFADAYARLGGAWISAGAPESASNACRAARQALALDQDLAAAHSVLATAQLSKLDWLGAEKERATAVKLAPNSEETLLESALNLAVMGNTDAALADLERARHANADSASQWRAILYGCVYAWCRQFDRALEIFDQFPKGGSWVHEQHAQVCFAKGDYNNAMRLERLAALERGEDAARVSAEQAALAKAFEVKGKIGYWKERLAREQTKQGENHFNADGRHLRLAAAAHRGLRASGARQK